MTADTGRSGRRGRLDPVTLRSLVLLYLTVQVPLLLTAPGRVVSDVSPITLLASGRALGRAVTAWDTHLGLGAVPRSGVGDLWPVGPWFWAMDQLGVPDWIAQRLWWGAILFAAGAGVLFLARTWRWRPEAGAAAAFVYALSPYVVTLVTQDSPSLLAFAGQPWLLAIAIRALRTPGWRHPSVFALVVATVGAADPGGLLVISAAPAGWLAFAVMRSTVVTRAGAAWTAAKMTLVSAAVNLWWILGLSVEGTNGTPAHPYDREPELVASTSTATEVLRGLGDWSFYATERGAAALQPSVHYTQSIALLVVTFTLAATGLLGLGVARWRHRVFAIGLLVVGVVVAVGAHPWDSPSPIGALIKLGIESDLPFALRSPSRAVPLIALALALGVGALVGASLEESHRRGVVAAVLAAVVAIAALPPLWLGEFVPDELDRAQELPGYWDDVASALEGDSDTRILEVPAVEHPAYRSRRGAGSVLAALVDRPVATRGRLPQGSAPSADLLRAIDTELVRGTLDSNALAPVARLLGAGDIVVRSDDDDDRAPAIWATVAAAPGLGELETFGPTSTAGDTTPPIGVVPVQDPVALVRANAADRVVILSGDGSGVLDAAAAGLLHGTELVRHSATLTDDPDFVRTTLRDQRLLVVTDTNRARAERWNGLYDTYGYTEQADGGPLRSDPADERLDVFDDRPGTQSVAVHQGISARATAYGDTDRYTPHERPVNAVDGDPATAWRVGAGGDAVGERIELTSAEAIETDAIRFLQATSGDARRISEIDLRFDGGDPVRVSLDQRSLSAPGQTVGIEQRAFETVDIEVVGVEGPGAAGVGFSVIDLGVDPTREYVRMPDDLLDAGGFRTQRYPLALVQTRLRSTAPGEPDEEPTLARIVDLPTARAYRLTGVARLSDQAGARLVDGLTGRSGDVAVTASSVGGGRLDRLPSNVLDDDPTTLWSPADGDTTPTLTFDADSIRAVQSVQIRLVDDGDHALPAEVAITVDGRAVGGAPVVAAEGTGERVVALDLPPAVVGEQVTLTFLGLDGPGEGADEASAPLTVSDVVIPEWAVVARAESIDTGCRNDLVFVDDVGIPVRVVGDTASALRGDPLALASCDAEPVRLPGGERRFDSAPGARTGIDIDRVVWCSAAGAGACRDDGPVLATGDPTPEVEVVASDDATVQVEVRGASPGTPFWLVLGQSFQGGWQIIDTEVEHSDAQLVDGYANGFLVTPDSETLELTIRFVPQNRVEIGLLLSLVGVIVALGLAIASGTVGRPVPIPLQEPLRRIRALTWEGALPTRRDAVIVGATGGVIGALVVAPVIGLGVGLLAGFATRRQGWRGAFTLAPALLLAASAVYVIGTQVRDETPAGPGWPAATEHLHTVALVAVVLLVVDLVIDRMWERRSDFR